MILYVLVLLFQKPVFGLVIVKRCVYNKINELNYFKPCVSMVTYFRKLERLLKWLQQSNNQRSSVFEKKIRSCLVLVPKIF